MIWLHPIPPTPVNNLSLFLSLPLCRRSSTLTGEGGRDGGSRQIIRQQESIILYLSFNILWSSLNPSGNCPIFIGVHSLSPHLSYLFTERVFTVSVYVLFSFNIVAKHYIWLWKLHSCGQIFSAVCNVLYFNKLWWILEFCRHCCKDKYSGFIFYWPYFFS
jgi:hypothetical protein